MLGVNRKNPNFFQTSWLLSNKNACSKALAIACSYSIESKFTTNVTFHITCLKRIVCQVFFSLLFWLNSSLKRTTVQTKPNY